MSLIMYFLSDFLIQLWLGDGEGAIEIARAVRYLSPSPMLASIISAYGTNGLMVFKKDKLYSNIIVFGSFCGLISGLILIPTHNFIGGAISIIIALFIKALLSLIYCIKTINSNNNFLHEV
jgi:O-antigen/teichoic acid export membrane protein